jgi:murein DD-endopeptidase MepM/ murein hydrolase activator NlpD
MKRFPLGLLLIVVFLTGVVLPLQARENWKGDDFCQTLTSQAPQTGITTIKFWNKSACELTIDLAFPKLIKAGLSIPNPFTTVLLPKEKVTMVTITPTDKSAWEYQYRYFWKLGSNQAEHDDSYVYTLPYPKGKTYKVIQGYNGTFSHNGEWAYSIDWDMPDGSEVTAAREGLVAYVVDSFKEHGTTPEMKDKTNTITIRHPDGTMGNYCHFKHRGSRVRVGDNVKVGQVIGLSGNVGYSDCPHLHFSVYKPVDGKTSESIRVTFRHGNKTLTNFEKGMSLKAD